MCKELSIGFVAPPFAGHLFPQIELANGLRRHGFEQIRFYSTSESANAVKLSGFELTPLLEGSSHMVLEISDTKQRVGGNPFRLLKQLRANLSLMQQLRSELRHHWETDRPDLVICDLTVPIAGLLAQEMNIHWWSSLPTVCVIETKSGTPSYLGGWQPPKTLAGRIRDTTGRRLTRVFKRSMHWMFRRQLKSLGVTSVYRADGFERVYSPEKILGLGISEFEFPRNWPPSLEFVGPLTSSPPLPHEPPEFVEGKPHILVSLGTHLWWAKDEARQLIRRVAQQMPELVFHFTDGNPRQSHRQIESNFHTYSYLPYDQYVHRYSATINHAGTGVMYACLKAAIPILAWPQDYDQFDHTARLVHHGLGLRCRPQCDAIVSDLRRLLNDEAIQKNVSSFQTVLDSYKTVERVVELLLRVES